ncbi:hypothetical protein [Streptomyces sp. NPDC049555]|uniref:hypothetical protein n=1 Tax=unclassified Streptomyces TaxID=2593676 RepID=UPI0034401333
MNDDPAPIDDPAQHLTDEPRGCLFALSQPPLMFFLAFIATLILLTAVHDLYRW